jgi:hypothetical protein
MMTKNSNSNSKRSVLIRDALNYSFKNIISILIGLGGGLIPFIIFFFDKEKTEINFFKGTTWLLFSIIIIFLFVLLGKFIINLLDSIFIRHKNQISVLQAELQKEKNKFKQQSVLPDFISFKDIQPYVIDESRAERRYILNPEKVSFDIEHRLIYKITGGNEEIDFIDHIYSSKGLKFNNKSFLDMDITLEKDNYKNKKFELKVVPNDTYHILKVLFTNQKLLPNEHIEYCILLKYKNYQFISREEFEKYSYSNKLKLPNEIEYARQASLGYKKLVLSLEFPNNYPVNLPGFSVSSKSNKLVNVEKERLERENSYKTYINTYINKLELTVNNPIVGLNYKIHWNPPTIENIESIKFLDKEQIEILTKKIRNDE